jgi:hypothetical protein
VARAIESDRARRVGVTSRRDLEADAGGFEAIQQSGEHDGTRSIEVLDAVEVDVDGWGRLEHRRGVRERTPDGGQVGQLNAAGDNQTGPISLPRGMNRGTHRAHPTGVGNSSRSDFRGARLNR